MKFPNDQSVKCGPRYIPHPPPIRPWLIQRPVYIKQHYLPLNSHHATLKFPNDQSVKFGPRYFAHPPPIRPWLIRRPVYVKQQYLPFNSHHATWYHHSNPTFHGFPHQYANYPISNHYHQPLHHQSTSYDKDFPPLKVKTDYVAHKTLPNIKLKTNSNNRMTNTSTLNSDIDLAKKFYLFLQCSHHLKIISVRKPPQFVNKIDFLTNFPKPPGCTNVLKEKFYHCAENWSNNVLKLMIEHYNDVIKSTISLLSNNIYQLSVLENALNLAKNWYKANHHKWSADNINELSTLIYSNDNSNLVTSKATQTQIPEISKVKDNFHVSNGVFCKRRLVNVTKKSMKRKPTKCQNTNSSCNNISNSLVAIESNNTVPPVPLIDSQKDLFDTQNNEPNSQKDLFDSQNTSPISTYKNNSLSPNPLIASQTNQVSEITSPNQLSNDNIFVFDKRRKNRYFPSSLVFKPNIIIGDERLLTLKNSFPDDFLILIIPYASFYSLYDLFKTFEKPIEDVNRIIFHFGYDSCTLKCPFSHAKSLDKLISRIFINCQTIYTSLISLEFNSNINIYNENLKSFFPDKIVLSENHCLTEDNTLSSSILDHWFKNFNYLN